MLVLSRQRDETIMIGDDIEVTVVDIRGDKVRLGINAPKEISVHRKEVYDAIRRENRAAAHKRLVIIVKRRYKRQDVLQFLLFPTCPFDERGQFLPRCHRLDHTLLYPSLI